MALVVKRELSATQRFLDGILAKLPEADRAAARAQYSQAQDELSGITAEINEAAERVNATADQQATWFNKHKDVIEGRTAPNKITEAVDGEKLTKDFTDKLGSVREELAGQGLFLATVIPTLIAQHHAEFGEVLDGEKLVQDALTAKQDIKTFYSGSVADRRRTVAETKRTAEITAATEAGRLAGLKEAGQGHMPYPTHRMAPTTLSGLKPPAEQAGQYTIEAAVQTANDVMSKQG